MSAASGAVAIVIVLAVVARPRAAAAEREYDVVIYGGSSAGAPAAVQTRRMGKTAGPAVGYNSRPADIRSAVMTRHWLVIVFCLAWACVPAGVLAHGGSGIALDEKGLVHFTDTKEGIWRIEPDGKLKLVHGGGLHWMTIDPEGKFAQAEDRTSPTTQALFGLVDRGSTGCTGGQPYVH